MIGDKDECLRWLTEAPAGRYEVNAYHRKRTTTQNRYYWALVGQLAAALGLLNDEMHFQLLKRYSTPQPFATLDHVDVSRFMRYFEEYNRTDKTVYYLFYKPSSEMNSKEFKRLLDGCISECQEVGVDTLTPEQVALMRRE